MSQTMQYPVQEQSGNMLVFALYLSQSYSNEFNLNLNGDIVRRNCTVLTSISRQVETTVTCVSCQHLAQEPQDTHMSCMVVNVLIPYREITIICSVFIARCI
jgi:hypothetical protein